MGAEDLLQNGKDVAVVEYHIDDIFETEAAVDKQMFYYVTGLPTAIFDGVLECVGGNPTVSLYPDYLPLYEQRKNILSDFTIDVQGANSQLTDYVITANIEKVAPNNSQNLALMVALTESEIDYVWMNQPHVDHCQRLMLPDANGTPLDFSSGDELEFSFSFSIDPDWAQQHCELVVWIQDLSTKEVQQTVKRHLSEFGGFPERDASIERIYTPVSMCLNAFTPSLEIINLGTDNLNSIDIYFKLDNEPEQLYSWTGDLPYLQKELVELPEQNAAVSSSSVFYLYLDNPNMQEDEYPYNDTSFSVIQEAELVASPVTLVLRLDDHPEQTSWELINSSGTALYTGSNYSVPNEFVTEVFDLGTLDCFTFRIFDSEGDGLTGSGLYKLMYGSTIFRNGNDFGLVDNVQFSTQAVEVEEHSIINDFSIYPNPASNVSNIAYYLAQDQHIKICLFNHLGQKVTDLLSEYQYEGDHSIRWSVEDLDPGMYFIQFSGSEGAHFTGKVIVSD